MGKKEIEISCFVSANIYVPGPILYYLNYFDQQFLIHSFFWEIIYKDKVFLIDTGIKNINYINKAVRSGNSWKRMSLNSTTNNIDFIFCTHFHYDHASNIYEYGDAKILISSKTYNNLFKERYKIIFDAIIFDQVVLSRIKQLNNVLVIEDGEELMNGVKVFWIGCHTPCSQCISFDVGDTNILFAGDTVMTIKNIEDKIPPGLNYNLIEFYDFYNHFCNSSNLIIPGHDLKAIELLQKYMV